MSRKDARLIGDFTVIDLVEVPGWASAPITDGEGSDAARVLRALHKEPNRALKIREPNPALRKSLGPLFNRTALSLASPIRYRWRGDYLYVWLA